MPLIGSSVLELHLVAVFRDHLLYSSIFPNISGGEQTHHNTANFNGGVILETCFARLREVATDQLFDKYLPDLFKDSIFGQQVILKYVKTLSCTHAGVKNVRDCDQPRLILEDWARIEQP